MDHSSLLPLKLHLFLGLVVLNVIGVFFDRLRFPFLFKIGTR